MKKLFSIFLPLVSFCLLRLAFYPTPVSAQETSAWGERCVKEINGVQVATIQGLECIFINIVRVLVPLVGLAFFIMLIAGSFQMMTAGSEPKAVQKARATITAAIFGLVLFFGIWFILLLIKTITGVNVTKFEIPGL